MLPIAQIKPDKTAKTYEVTEMNKTGVSRRRFLGQTGSMALALPLASLPAAAQVPAGLPAMPHQRPRSGPATIPYRDLPVRQRGKTVIPVDPPTDGVSDCSQVIQNAINALPDDGGTVLVKYHRTGGVNECVYMINTTANVNAEGHETDPRYYGILLRSNMLLQFEPGVQLQAMPNNVKRAYVLWAQAVHDVEIANGALIGERFTHTNSGHGTDEWGYGIALAGVTGVTVRSMHISDFEGDGISIARGGDPIVRPTDVVLWDVVCTGNRRQGVSITSGDGIYLLDSEFSNTHGTAPADGVDIEGTVSNVTIDNCVLVNNQGNGVELNAGTTAKIINVNITNSVLAGNYSGVYTGSRTTSLIDTGTIYGNAIYQNRSIGLSLRGGNTKNFTVGGASSCDPLNNSFANNNVLASDQVLFPTPVRTSKKGYIDGPDMTLSPNAQDPAFHDVVGWNNFYAPGNSSSKGEPHPCPEPPAWGRNRG